MLLRAPAVRRTAALVLLLAPKLALGGDAVQQAPSVPSSPGTVVRAEDSSWTARYLASPDDVVSNGLRWRSDRTVAKDGSWFTSATPIAGTDEPALFRTQRLNSSGYRVPVPTRGTYRVTFGTAELYWSRPGQRVFDVLAEGRSLADHLDVAAAVGRNTALTRSVDVDVVDGTLDLTFRGITDQPTVANLVVQQTAVSAATPAQAPVEAAARQLTPRPHPSVQGHRRMLTPLGPLHTARQDGRAGDGQLPRAGLFPATSVWRTRPVGPPAADSPRLVANLTKQVATRYGGTAGFNVGRYDTAYVEAGRGQRRHDVAFTDCQNKGYVPKGLTGPGGQFSAVPVPEDAEPSQGGDASLSIYQPSTDTLWSFWRFSRRPDGSAAACWGGRIDHVSTSLGMFAGGFGTSASGLAHEGGTIGVQQARGGRIDHALALGIPDVAHWSRVSWPAQRSDGNDRAPDAIAMGTRFRLDPAVDVDSLRLHPLASMVAHAAQDYGFLVTDKSGLVSVGTESGRPTVRRTGVDPWTALLAGTPTYLVMRDFPWNRLQAMPADFGKPAG